MAEVRSMGDRFRKLPSVDRIVARLEESGSDEPRPMLVRAARDVLEDVRRWMKEDESRPAPNFSEILDRVWRLAGKRRSSSYKKVVNATGVLLHTNLGRAVTARQAARAASAVASSYSNLEYDLESGSRGHRASAVEERLCRLSGAESALVVNNNAAAVYLVLRSLARDKSVIVSRGELVEIGGAFRIPDVLEASGARLVEVGTTNRTRLSDYETAIGEDTALLLKVHRSNFAVVGFTEEVDLASLAGLAGMKNIPLVYDMGSSLLVESGLESLDSEHVARNALVRGADVVCFSGDKLLGGPQAGIVLGRSDLVEPMRGEPMLRAFRLDKMTLAALDVTLMLLETEPETVPVLSMLRVPVEDLQARAEALKEKIQALAGPGWRLDVVASSSKIGGGTSPLLELESRALKVVPSDISASELESMLRSSDVPIVSVVREDAVLLDVRTLLEGDEEHILKALGRVMEEALV